MKTLMIWAVLLLFPLVSLKAQGIKDIIDQVVDTNNKRVEAAKKKKEKEEEAKKEAEENTDENGQAKLQNDEDTDPSEFYDLSPNTGNPNQTTNATPKEKDPLELLEEGGVDPSTAPQRLIDTVGFIRRMSSSRIKDILLYARGKKMAPITNHIKYDKQHELNEEYKVFGWHPYWMKNAYESYNFSLLSVVSYFSYEVNPSTGGYKTIHDWQTTGLIDAAHKQDCKVLLSATNFGVKNNERFLSNVRAQKNFIRTIQKLVKARGADGVHIDFEQVPRKSAVDFTNFIVDLATTIRGKDPDFYIAVTLPAIDFAAAYDVAQLKGYVSMFIILGTDFYGTNTEIAGPLAPIKGGQNWWGFGLERAVGEYLAAGADPKKLILAFPYYGAEWRTESLQFPSKAKKFLRYMMYRDIRQQFGKPISNEDADAMSQCFAYRDAGNNYKQLWYNDSLSFSKKYDWVIQQKIGGIGIWALGYDNGYKELWGAIANKFAVDNASTNAKAGVAAKGKKFNFRRFLSYITRVIRNPTAVLRNPRSVLSLFGILFGTSMTGFFLLYRYGCRLKRMTGLLLRGSFVMFMVMALGLIAIVASRYNNDYVTAMAFLFGGLLIGAIIFILLSRRFLSEAELP